MLVTQKQTESYKNPEQKKPEWVQGAWMIGLQPFHLEHEHQLLQKNQQLHIYQYKAQLLLSQMLLNPTFT